MGGRTEELGEFGRRLMLAGGRGARVTGVWWHPAPELTLSRAKVGDKTPTVVM